MPNNPNLSSHVGAYIDLALKERLNRITKSSRRLTTSRLIEECLAAHLPKIEKRVAKKEVPS